MILIFDTETTGLINWKLSLSAPEQPHLVQLGLILCADDGRIVMKNSLLVKPDGFEIPEKMIHGISNEKALKEGTPLPIVLGYFREAYDSSSLLVAHNYVFDRSVMQSELRRSNVRDTFQSKQSFCTMLETMNIVKKPAKAGRHGYKWPKLEETYEHFFPGEKISGAHDALNDCLAVHRIYFEGLKKGSHFNRGGTQSNTPSFIPAGVSEYSSIYKKFKGMRWDGEIPIAPVVNNPEKEIPNTLPESFPTENTSLGAP